MPRGNGDCIPEGIMAGIRSLGFPPRAGGVAVEAAAAAEEGRGCGGAEKSEDEVVGGGGRIKMYITSQELSCSCT